MEEIGLRAIFESDEFSNGVKVYMAGVALADKATGGFASTVMDKISGAVAKATPYIQVLSGFFQKMPGDADRASQSMGTMAESTSNAAGASDKLSIADIALGDVIGNILTKALDFATTKLKDFIVGCTMGEARSNELALAAQFMGAQAGLTASDVDALTQKLLVAGATDDMASEAITKLSQNNLDASKAVELLNVAQGASIITGRDVASTYEQIVQAVSMGYTRSLRMMGLNVDQTQAQEDFAASLGKTKEELTEVEQKQAILNAVIAKGSNMMGLYAEGMKLPSVQLRDLTSVQLPKLMDALGAPFQEAFSNIVSSITEMVIAFRLAVEEGGMLNEFMTNFGAVVALVTDVFKNATNAVLSFVGLISPIAPAISSVTASAQPMTIAISGASNAIATLGTSIQTVVSDISPLQSSLNDISNWFNNTFGGLIDNALIWGSNFVTEFANGIIQGVGVVADALTYIADMVTYWLSSGSPPKLLPKLDQWGAAAMEEYLKGWSKADFSIFKDVSSTISNILKSTAGKDDKGLIPTILGSREALAQSIVEINKVGSVTTAAIDRIVQAAGVGTTAFREYITTTLQAELAAGKLQDAQNELTEVTAFYDEELRKLNETLGGGTQKVEEEQRLKKISAALASGMLTDEEKQRLMAEKNQILTKQRIRAVEKERAAAIDAAKAKVVAAATEYDDVQKRMELAKMTLDLTTEQNTLIKQQIDLLERLAKAAEKSVAKKAGGVGGKKTCLEGFHWDDKKGTCIKDISGVQEAGGAAISGAKSPIEQAKEAIIKSLQDLWAKLTQPITNFFAQIQQKIANSGIVQAFERMWNAVKEKTTGILSEITKFFNEWWDKYGRDVTLVFEWYRRKLDEFGVWYADWWAKSKMGEQVQNTLDAIKRIWHNTWENIKHIFFNFTQIIGETIGAFLALVTGDQEDFKEHVKKIWKLLWDSVMGNVTTAWENLKIVIGLALTNLKIILTTAWENLKTDAAAAWENLKTTIQEKLDSVLTSIETWGTDLKTKINSKIQDVIDAFSNFSIDFYNMGRDIILGMIEGVVAYAQQLIEAVLNAVGSGIQAVKDALRMFSPSQVFADLGKNMMLGMAQGIDKTSNVVNAALERSSANMASMYGSSISHTNSSIINNNQQYYSVNVSPTYEQVQSPSGIYYDVQAALAAARA